MNNAALACPYCNALVPAPAELRPGQRVPCPRCGESFPYRPANGQVDTPAFSPDPVSPLLSSPGLPGGGSDSGSRLARRLLWIALAAGVLALLLYGSLSLALQHLPPDEFAHNLALFVRDRLTLLLGGVAVLAPWAAVWLWYFRRPRSNGATALFIVGNMVMTAAIGLTYASWTTAFRRSHDVLTPSPEKVVVRHVPPARLAALGFLPPDTDLVAGVHVAELRQDPAGREFLQHLHPPALGPDHAEALQLDLGQPEHWLGVSLEEIDHVVLGLKVEDRLWPRVTLIVQTHHRYDPEKVRATLRASLSSEGGKREVYHFEIKKPPLDAGLLFAGERTLVLGSTVDDLKAVPETAQPGVDHLDPAFREVLQERVAPGSQAWLIGRSEDWDRTGVKWLLETRPPKERQVLKTIQTFALGLRFDQELTLTGSCRCRDARAAEALEHDLVAEEGERKPFQLLGTVADSPVARELGQSLKVVREGEWLTLQARAATGTVRQTVGTAK